MYAVEMPPFEGLDEEALFGDVLEEEGVDSLLLTEAESASLELWDEEALLEYAPIVQAVDDLFLREEELPPLTPMRSGGSPATPTTKELTGLDMGFFRGGNPTPVCSQVSTRPCVSRSREEIWCPPPAPVSPPGSIVIAYSGYGDQKEPGQQELLKKMRTSGVQCHMAGKPEGQGSNLHYDVLVTPRRDFGVPCVKKLFALAKAVPVVCEDWIRQSVIAGTLLPKEPYTVPLPPEIQREDGTRRDMSRLFKGVHVAIHGSFMAAWKRAQLMALFHALGATVFKRGSLMTRIDILLVGKARFAAMDTRFRRIFPAEIPESAHRYFPWLKWSVMCARVLSVEEAERTRKSGGRRARRPHALCITKKQGQGNELPAVSPSTEQPVRRSRKRKRKGRGKRRTRGRRRHKHVVRLTTKQLQDAVRAGAGYKGARISFARDRRGAQTILSVGKWVPNKRRRFTTAPATISVPPTYGEGQQDYPLLRGDQQTNPRWLRTLAPTEEDDAGILQESSFTPYDM